MFVAVLTDVLLFVGIRVAVYVVAGRVVRVDIVNQPIVISGVNALIKVTVVY